MGCRTSKGPLMAVESVGGKSVLPLPECLRSRIMWSIGEAERLKGSPPTSPEVIATFRMSYTKYIYRGYLIVII